MLKQKCLCRRKNEAKMGRGKIEKVESHDWTTKNKEEENKRITRKHTQEYRKVQNSSLPQTTSLKVLSNTNSAAIASFLCLPFLYLPLSYREREKRKIYKL